MVKKSKKRKLTYTKEELLAVDSHWQWGDSLEDAPEHIAGFIYLIINHITHELYIGCKHLRVTNWPYYIGSSKYLKEAIDEYGKENFSFEVLQVTRNRTQTIIAEEQWQLEYNVVADPNFYNRHIGGRVWAGIHAHSEETKVKMANSHLGMLNHQYKGRIIAKKGKDVLYFEGREELIAAGFVFSNVYRCIRGERKTHRGYTWSRDSN